MSWPPVTKQGPVIPLTLLESPIPGVLEAEVR